MKKSDKVMNWLTARGARELPSTSKKYRKFTYPPGQPGDFAFVGKAGALRVGPNVTKSISLTPSRTPAAEASEHPYRIITRAANWALQRNAQFVVVVSTAPGRFVAKRFPAQADLDAA